MNSNVQSLLVSGAKLTDAALERLLPSPETLPHSIHRAMRHSVFAGGKRLRPLLCMEANSSFLWDAELRPGNAGTWDGSLEVLETSFANVPLQIRELRVRADAGFGFHPVFAALEARPA